MQGKVLGRRSTIIVLRLISSLDIILSETLLFPSERAPILLSRRISFLRRADTRNIAQYVCIIRSLFSFSMILLISLLLHGNRAFVRDGCPIALSYHSTSCSCLCIMRYIPFRAVRPQLFTLAATEVHGALDIAVRYI